MTFPKRKWWQSFKTDYHHFSFLTLSLFHIHILKTRFLLYHPIFIFSISSFITFSQPYHSVRVDVFISTVPSACIQINRLYRILSISHFSYISTLIFHHILSIHSSISNKDGIIATVSCFISSVGSAKSGTIIGIIPARYAARIPL